MHSTEFISKVISILPLLPVPVDGTNRLRVTLVQDLKPCLFTLASVIKSFSISKCPFLFILIVPILFIFFLKRFYLFARERERAHAEG